MYCDHLFSLCFFFVRIAPHLIFISNYIGQGGPEHLFFPNSMIDKAMCSQSADPTRGGRPHQPLKLTATQRGRNRKPPRPAATGSTAAEGRAALGQIGQPSPMRCTRGGRGRCRAGGGTVLSGDPAAERRKPLARVSQLSHGIYIYIY